MVRPVRFYFFLVFLLSCSLQQGHDLTRIKSSFRERDYERSLEILESSEEYKEEKNRLLYHLEKGTLLFRQKKHYLSTLSFQKAKSIIEALYTKRVSKKALSLIVNESVDIYYGENYEKSLLHLYQAVNFYTLYRQGYYEAYEQDGVSVPKRELNDGERKRELMRARAEIVAWNTLLETLQMVARNMKDRHIFQNDMMAKIFGAVIHESVDTSTDRQIALQLYKDAWHLMKRYRSYKSFSEDDPKAPSKSHNQGLEQYLHKQILRLTQAIRPYEVRKVRKQFAMEKDLQAHTRNNLTLLVEKGSISDKTGQRQYFSLGRVLEDPDNSAVQKIMAGVAAVVLMNFAVNKLELLPPPHTWNPVGAHLGFNTAAHLALEGASIDFEIPVLRSTPEMQTPVVIVKDQEGNIVEKRNLVLTGPVDNIAEEAIALTSSRLYGKLGFRLAIKYLAAIVASYATYSLLVGEENDNDFLAKNAAVIQYMAAAKAIAKSEKADIRYWTTLPKSLWFLDMSLKKGDYRLFITDTGNQEEKLIGNVSITDDQSRQFLHVGPL